jgi:hypothetical protein
MAGIGQLTHSGAGVIKAEVPGPNRYIRQELRIEANAELNYEQQILTHITRPTIVVRVWKD